MPTATSIAPVLVDGHQLSLVALVLVERLEVVRGVSLGLTAGANELASPY